jgi:hypothetical protein
MKISVKDSWYSTHLIFEAENVKVDEDISETIYGTKEDGKTDFTKRLGKDISEDYMNQFITLLDDIVYYRVAPFDSSDLITKLVEKLPVNVRKGLIEQFIADYTE